MWSNKKPDTPKAADSQPTNLETTQPTKVTPTFWQRTTNMNNNVIRPIGATADPVMARLSMERQIELRHQHRPCGHAQCGNPAKFAASYERMSGNPPRVVRNERVKSQQQPHDDSIVLVYLFRPSVPLKTSMELRKTMEEMVRLQFGPIFSEEFRNDILTAHA